MSSSFQATAAAETPREPRRSDAPTVEGATLAARYRGDRTGGDFYDFVMTPAGYVLFLMCDIAGKRNQTFGIAAGLQEIFEEVGPKLFPEGDGNESLALTQLALDLNRGVMQIANGVRCTAAFLACYVPKLGAAWYVNAGHIPGILHTGDGDCVELGASGIPFGLFSHTTHDAQLVVVPPRGRLVVPSKGLVELRTHSEEFGMERTRAAVTGCTETAAAKVAEAVLAASDQYIKDSGVHAFGLFGRNDRHPDRTALALVRD